MRDENQKRQPLHRFHYQRLRIDRTQRDDSTQERASRRRRIDYPNEQEDTDDSYNNNENVIRNDSDEEIQLNMPFCCAICCCSERKKAETIPDIKNDSFIVDNLSHFHRLCCHNGKEYVAAKEIQWGNDDSQEDDDDDDEEKDGDDNAHKAKRVTVKDVQRYINNANREESKYFNTDDLEVEADRLLSNPAYAELVMKDFHQESKKKRKQGLVVLDLFGGVGTGLLVLKRLKLPVRKVIHVEHDLVAAFVSRMNHDYRFVQSLREFAHEKKMEGEDGGYTQLSEWNIPDDGIEHEYYRRFEDIFDIPSKGHVARGINRRLQVFLEKHVQTDGIDLIIAGPPCIDYSGVNARREGTEGKQGKYLLFTGQLFQEIQKNQYRKVYVMAENVMITNESERKKISKAFGFQWDPVEVDAWQVSPGRRRRNFFTNIPYSDTEEGHRYCGVTPESCLDDEYSLAQMLLKYDENGVAFAPRRMKANTFMASKSRQKDNRMHVFKQDKNRFLMRVYNVTERERIMGYPEGYVQKPVSMLFEILWSHGYARLNKYSFEIEGQPAEAWPREKGWREMLPPELHVFAGNFLGRISSEKMPFRFKGFPPKVKLAPAPSGQTMNHFDDTEYSMYLIGNAFSVPALELVLFRLKELFDPSEEQRSGILYQNWLYPYKWTIPTAATPLEENILCRDGDEDNVKRNVVLNNGDERAGTIIRTIKEENSSLKVEDVTIHDTDGATTEVAGLAVLEESVAVKSENEGTVTLSGTIKEEYASLKEEDVAVKDADDAIAEEAGVAVPLKESNALKSEFERADTEPRTIKEESRTIKDEDDVCDEYNEIIII